MFERRHFLKLAASASLAGVPGLGESARAQGGVEAVPFDSALLAEMARVLAKRPYKAAATDLPDPFNNMPYDQYVGIRRRSEALIWGADTIGFALEPLHRGFLFGTPMALHIVENGLAQKLVYDASKYDFGKMTPPGAVADIGFSGFRVLQPREGESMAELAIFQGASFFRSLARGQNLGTMARALAVRTADPRGEEFPMIRAMWIERPVLANGTLVMHALIDSESMTGAYRFTLRPGEATIIDTECTLFARANVDHIGLGAMTATFLYGPIDRRRSDDLRPGVYEVNGLQMLTGAGEWIWRPVANRENLQISGFIDKNPRGFGFLQRDRNFERFQDDDQHWEMRPSLWIEPIGDWGEGLVQLVEIPSDSEVNDNIIAYWRPKAAMAAGAEASYAYRQFWCWTPPEHAPLAVVSGSRGGRGSQGKKRRFAVDFTSEMFGDAQRSLDIKPALNAVPGTISGIRVFLSRERKTCRVFFEMDPGAEAFCEIRLMLESGGKPLSETWLYRWTA